MTFSLIVAHDRARGIGLKGELPWRLAGDMAHFVEITRGSGGNAVIMGRATWESIPPRYRPLSGRANVVLSRQAALELPEGVVRAHTLDEALAANVVAGARETFIIGGADVYAQALAHPDCGPIYLTVIDGDFGCDVFFPELPPRFERVDRSEPSEEGGIRYWFERWQPAPSNS